MKKKIIDGKVLCKCGKEPYMSKTCAYNECHYVLECPTCGNKGATETRSELMAISAWEGSDWAK